MLLVWGLICQTATPRAARTYVQPENDANRPVDDSDNWMKAFSRAVLPAHFFETAAISNTTPEDTLTGAVITRTRPTLNSGRIDGSLRVLKPEAFSVSGNTGVIDSGGPSSVSYKVSTRSG